MSNEISFSGTLYKSKRPLRYYADYVSQDYLGLNAALYEWAESYDSKVGRSRRCLVTVS